MINLWGLDKNPYVKSLTWEKNSQFTRVVRFTSKSIAPIGLIALTNTFALEKKVFTSLKWLAMRDECNSLMNLLFDSKSFKMITITLYFNILSSYS